MGREWLELVVNLLANAGLRSGEEYAVGAVPDITEPVAAVGLSGLDCGAGQANIMVRVLSPRTLGGWECQTAAAGAVAVLEAQNIHCQMGKMEYLSGCDCYSIPITAVLEICLVDGDWERGSPWTVQAGTTVLEWVNEFSAEQDQQRRMVGATCQTDPVGVTPGSGGWTIRLVMQIPQGGEETQMPAEPFVLTAQQEEGKQIYRDCYWNEVSRSCTQSGMKVVWQGFAMTREVQ